MKIDFALPVYNEEACLSVNVSKLISYLQSKALCDWQVIIVDNASTDETPIIADVLAAEIYEVHAVHLEQKGRGYALKSAFQSSQADAIIYMDIDLSTELGAIPKLVRSIESGAYDLSIGSRLKKGSVVIGRSHIREFISRSYNLLIRGMFFNGFHDAQCGFKGVRLETIRQLLPLIQNKNWFFDTELLVLAEYASLKVRTVPVKWIEDPDTRVNIPKTVYEDIKSVKITYKVKTKPFFKKLFPVNNSYEIILNDKSIELD